MSGRVGFGFDTHRFSDDPQRALWLGGVRFEGPGLVGHSDADVVMHAVVDALLGAAGLGDIGQHFSDTDPQWSGVASSRFLESVVTDVTAAGWRIANVDITVVTERPKIAPRREAMQDVLRALVSAPVNVKASRAEGLGALGRVEGAACWAVALLEES